MPSSFGSAMTILLPVLIFVSWFLFSLVPAGRLAIEDQQNNVPKDKRRGTSILPEFPLFPVIAWGVAVATDHFIHPWGSWIFIGLHVALLVISISIITRDLIRLRRIST